MPTVASPIDSAVIDNELRSNDPPFDGLDDLASWLGLPKPWPSFKPPSIQIRVSPPTDLMMDKCGLKDDQFTLTLHAHPHFDVRSAGLAIRTIPGKGLKARRQVISEVAWHNPGDEKLVGNAVIQLEHVDSVLAILQVGQSTVRRQWFLDPVKARNSRLVAAQLFDTDLKMIRKSVLQNTDANSFEDGVAALLFLLGFSPAKQIETNAPDLIVTTPSGKLIIVECTTRIADFSKKLGKLVDRRGALSRTLKESEHFSEVNAVLVCALPQEQIATNTEDISKHQVMLVTQEELVSAFDNLRFPIDPDRLLETGFTSLIT